MQTLKFLSKFILYFKFGLDQNQIPFWLRQKILKSEKKSVIKIFPELLEKFLLWLSKSNSIQSLPEYYIVLTFPSFLFLGGWPLTALFL